MSMETVAVADPGLALDHLVVAAATLAQGVQWCEKTLGITPSPGGDHALMGTHNRLLSVATPSFPLAYLEIIAINPAAPGPAFSQKAGRRRWFGLDEPALQHSLAEHGPQLVHWVARSPALDVHRRLFTALDLQPGNAVAASRPTANGLLQWQMLLRPDGRTLLGGALPTLIEWQGTHPAQAMPPSGVTLQSLQLRAPWPAGVQALLNMPQLQCNEGPGPALTASLLTPLGARQLQSP